MPSSRIGTGYPIAGGRFESSGKCTGGSSSSLPRTPLMYTPKTSPGPSRYTSGGSWRSLSMEISTKLSFRSTARISLGTRETGIALMVLHPVRNELTIASATNGSVTPAVPEIRVRLETSVTNKLLDILASSVSPKQQFSQLVCIRS